MHHWTPRPIATALLTLAVLAAGCTAAPPPEPPPLRPVRTITVGATSAVRQRSFAGTAHAGQESRLSFKVAGTVKRVPVKVGDAVKPGALLAELDAQDYALQVEQARASLAQATAQQRNAKATFERTRELFANRTVSKSEFDAARAAADSAAAAVRAASKQVQLLSQQRGYTRLTAPAAGSIAAVAIDVNENVAAGQVVMVLTAGQQIDVKVSVPGVLITQITKGSEATVRFAALPGRSFAARVREVGVAPEGAGAAYPVSVRLEAPDPAIRPGMTAEAVFALGAAEHREHILVPAVAVGEDRKGRFVYLVTPGPSAAVAVVKRRAVEVGELTSAGLEITTGLQPGDVVVTAGLSFLEDGREVRPPKTAGQD